MSDNEKIEKTGADAQAASKPAKADKKAKKDEKPGFFQRVARWFREMKSELKKVVWPTPKQTVNNTVIVIVCVIVVGIFIWVFDALASGIIAALIDLFKG
ncbi:preprotein translocase subunit SecE [Intestinimonas sp.]|uniref:preprotein translocase subunit SecE n=1 Tax=Intestinimonas sp. TaxID=1965293 RepID=UPI002612B31A|nr:preprotein translocase subunit SecE [Intestinimonas sp.]